MGRMLLAVAGSAFTGEFRPRQSGLWRLQVTPSNGARLQGDMPSLPIRIVADSAPVVEIPVPGADTVATASMSLALVVGVRDDHGITAAALETRRNGAALPTRTALPLPPGGSDRALITTAVNLGALGLKAGDTLRYLATATDNSPARHVGRSREFVVRIPTEAEQRAREPAKPRPRRTHSIHSASRRRACSAPRRTWRASDSAPTRSRPTARPANDGQKDPLASEAARTAAAAAQAQQQVLDDAAKLQRAVQELREAAERQGVSDSALARELSEINRLLDKALSPELRAKLASLQQAVKDLDADRTRDALQDLAKQQAHAEGSDGSGSRPVQARRAGNRPGEPGAGCQAVGSGAARPDPETCRQRQRQVGQGRGGAGEARPTPSVRGSIARRPRCRRSSRAKACSRRRQQAQDAAGKMRQAAQSSQSGQAGAAQAQGKQAEDELNPLSKKIDDNRQNMQAEMRAEVKQALERALEETARLADHQLAVAQAIQQGALLPQTRVDQGLVEEGAGKVMQQIAAAAAMNALVSPQAAVGACRGAPAHARSDRRDLDRPIPTCATPSRSPATRSMRSRLRRFR